MSKNKVPKYAKNQTRLAEILSAEFHVKIVRQQVHRWITTLDGPKSDSGGRHRIAPWLDWYRRNLSPVVADAVETTSLTAIRREREILDLENARFTAESRRGIWIKKSESRLSLASCAKRFHAMIKWIETKPERLAHERLKELGLNDQTIAAAAGILREIGIEIVTEIENECQKIAAEAEKAKADEVKAA